MTIPNSAAWWKAATLDTLRNERFVPQLRLARGRNLVAPIVVVKASLACPGSVNALQQGFEAGIGAQGIEGGLA